MSDLKKIKHPLKRDGTSQSDRFPAALNPNKVLIDGKDEKDLVDFTYAFADLVKYYGLDNTEDGNWQAFFEKIKAAADGSHSPKPGQLEPHLGLFKAFLQMFRLHQNELNKISKKHLDFFYEKVLQFTKKPSTADAVHVVFEAAKNSLPVLIPKHTLLKAGKDNKGIEQLYETDEDLLVNKASVAELKSVYVDSTNHNQLHIGEVVNSLDGRGEPLLDEDPAWYAFGNPAFEKAEIGFALASPALWLKEGKRSISVELTLRPETGTKIPASVLENAFKIYLSGENEWLGPFSVSPSYSLFRSKATLAFQLELSASDDPISFYDPEIYTDNIGSIFPVMKVMLNHKTNHFIYPYLQSAIIEKASIQVKVSGITELTVENDQGMVDATKPFMPFGSRPLKGSSFLLGSEEAFSKHLDDFDIHVQWQDVPAANLRSFYGSGYTSDEDSWLNYSLGSDAFRARMFFLKKGSTIGDQTIDLFNSANNNWDVTYSMVDNSSFAFTLPIFKLKQSLNFNPATGGNAFTRKIDLYTRQSLFLNALQWLQAPKREQKLKSGYVRFELLHDFLHKSYQEKYTRAVAQFQNWTGGELKLPKEPYTPLIQSISLDYETTYSADLSLNTASDFRDKEVELHHMGPFGSREVHKYIIDQLPDSVLAPITLLPEYSHAGSLLIGVKGIESGQSLSMLFQIAEGSADPETDNEAVHWHVLIDEYWMPLDEDHLLADHTDGFLKSGLIKLIIPKEASFHSDWLGAGLLWLKASVKNNTHAVCKLIGIHTQAVKATFHDQGNDPLRYATPLAAGAISKFLKTVPGIKSITQPYASFGGHMKESEKGFYTRVSERLRHKSRAITLFDYERLILEHFPSVYKVKCLNHTSPLSFNHPGHITLVLVPDLTNQNALNKLEPRVSKAMLEHVKQFAEEMSSALVHIHTKNPNYEKIRLDFKVRFKKTFEFGYYKNLLNQELIQYLSPWAYGSSDELSFGGRIHKSVLLKFVEDRSYVDFVSEFKMYHLQQGLSGNPDKEEVVAGTADAILVSHENHLINNYQES